MNGEERLFDIAEFQKMRTNKEAFAQFCENILPCVVGRKFWDKRVASICVSEIATDTDEAWALLVMENSWDTWKEQAFLETGKYEKGQEREPTKWTNTSSRASRSEGWGEAGIKRFNQIAGDVIKNREQNEAVELDYLKVKREEYDNLSSRKKRKKRDDNEKTDSVDSFGALSRRKDAFAMV